MARKRTIDRNRILDAAEKVVFKSGAQALTLDMVAAQAAISKGGLTYTFATKEALLSAMLDRDIDRLRERLEAVTGAQENTAYPELQMLMQLCCNNRAPARKNVAPILAALMYSPGSLKSTRSFFKWMWSRLLTDQVSDRPARIVFLAIYGVILMQGFRLLAFPPSTCRLLHDDFTALLEKPASRRRRSD